MRAHSFAEPKFLPLLTNNISHRRVSVPLLQRSAENRILLMQLDFCFPTIASAAEVNCSHDACLKERKHRGLSNQYPRK
jgi:hypothetical protein